MTRGLWRNPPGNPRGSWQREVALYIVTAVVVGSPLWLVLGFVGLAVIL